MTITAGPQFQRGGQQRERLRALYHLAVELSAQRDLKSVLNTALRQCLKLTESQFGFIGLNTADGSAMDVAAIQGFHPSPDFYARFHLIPLRPNIFSRVVLENRAIRSDDATTDPTRVGQPRGHPPVRTFLGVPLLVRDKPIGMIGVANRPSTYDDEHEQLLVTYAAQVAIAIRNAQLYEELTTAKQDLEVKVAERTQQLEEAKQALAQKADQLQRLLSETVDVQEHERQRIAQDLHDGINQLLIGALLELKSARERIGANDLHRADQSLTEVRSVLRRVESELRQIIHDLRPPTLDALGLVPAFRRYVSRFQQYSGITSRVRVEGETYRMSPDVETSVYRIMQEALQNVGNHSKAYRAGVSLRFGDDVFTMIVTDNGVGFDHAAVQSDGIRHLGLIGMAERAERMGGRLQIDTKPDVGTQVRLILPRSALQ